ncbi:DNA repair helicase [Meredithblackwellia eburnea MCA 4105]
MQGDDFSFPFTPYSIQLDLMRHVYNAIESNKVAVVESPTGTGKSLSLICSTLTYLNHASAHARAQLVEDVRAQVAASSNANDEPDWVLQQEVERQLRELDRAEKELEDRLEEIRRQEKQQLLGLGGDAAERRRKRIKLDHNGSLNSGATKEDDDQFAPDPYDSDQDENAPADEYAADNYTPAVREAIKRRANGGSFAKEVEEPDVRKIFYASRTHSQLSQFVSEVRKTTFATPPPHDDPSSSTTSTSPPTTTSKHPIRVIPLGSRQQLCINDQVRLKSRGNNEALGDLCLELQKAGGEGNEKRCKFLPPQSEPGKLNTFRDKALAQVHDIEDIEDLGRKLKTCPYYGSRRAVRSAELVTLPYNLLMQSNAREALGISLKNHVVVIDEAHNLISSLLSLHSVSISLSALNSLRSALMKYLTKFKSRLKGSNAVYLKELLVILKCLAVFAEDWMKSPADAKNVKPKQKQKQKEGMMGVNEFLRSLKGGAVDQVNMIKLDNYLKVSKIANKVRKCSCPCTFAPLLTSQFHTLQSFLLCLTNADKAGRILVSTSSQPSSTVSEGSMDTQDVTLAYMLLAPSESFRDIAEEAKSVILAGGTMKPISDFREQLFPYLAQERFTTFSCGHIIPPENIATFAVGKGPTGRELLFTFETRKDEKLVDELGTTIANICNIIPKGIVVFVPSYAFLDQIQARWTSSGMLERLSRRKKPFWEPKSSSDVESTLSEYSEANSDKNAGGVLFAVVDAKLSEGINFANDMARAVIICGIPYPNRNSTEVKERMAYLNSQPRSSTKGPSPGDVLYQNMAFRGVNQSIGRAIRHQADWAAIILLDQRYTRSDKQSQLPGWIGGDVRSPTNFGGLISGLATFCKSHKEKPL